jgi:hypothetical protein
MLSAGPVPASNTISFYRGLHVCFLKCCYQQDLLLVKSAIFNFSAVQYFKCTHIWLFSTEPAIPPIHIYVSTFCLIDLQIYFFLDLLLISVPAIS